MKMFSFSSVLYVFAIFSVAFCGGCENPQVNSKSFTTLDATIVANIAYISEFEMQCSSGAPATLYADIEGSIVPVSVVGNNKFQVIKRSFVAGQFSQLLSLLGELVGRYEDLEER